MTKRTGEEALQDRIDEEVEARLSRLLELLRHELRTPIGSILTLSDLITEHGVEGHTLSSSQSDYVDAIRQSAETALNILQNLTVGDPATALSALTDAPLLHKTFSFGGFLTSLEGHHKQAARAKGLEFNVKHGEKLPERIIAPLTAWRQILDNLLSNAIKYTEKGSVSFCVVVEKDYLAFHVQDTGAGLLSAGGHKLFEAYERGSNAGSANGQGLGLALVKALTARCEGALSFRSTPEEGTHFYLRLPYDKAAPSAQKKPRPSAKPPVGRNILVVEDNPINRMLIETLLDKFGHKVTQAVDGPGALKLAAKSRYDLVLMDIELPGGMNGFEVSKALKALKNWKPTPIIALSAHDGPEVEEKIAAHGLDGFIAKPLSARALYTGIEAACGKAARSAD